MAPQNDYNNILFLFKCIESNGIKIDFSKAAPALGIKPNAARMRYARLRKAVENVRQHSSSALIPRVRASTTDKKTLADKATFIEHEDEEIDQRSTEDIGSETATHAYRHLDNTKRFSVRATRGHRIDYSEAPELELSGKSDADDVGDRTSEYSDASNTVDDVKPSQEAKTPTRAASTNILTPPKSKQSIKQVSVSPQPPARFSRSSLTSKTPPYGIKRKLTFVTQGTDKQDKIRAELLNLATGQKISATTLKRRRLSIDENSRGQMNALTRDSSCDLSLNAVHNVTNEKVDQDQVVGSVCPEDSVSMAEDGESQNDKRRAVPEKCGHVIGTSFMQRLSALWK